VDHARDMETKLKAECGNQTTEYPKPFVELSIEEKIERTRQMVKSIHQSLGYLDDRTRQALSLRDDLIDHRHAMDDGGKVMLPAEGGRRRLNDYGGCCNAAQEVSPEKAYF
jgi:hypothetical protein